MYAYAHSTDVGLTIDEKLCNVVVHKDHIMYAP